MKQNSLLGRDAGVAQYTGKNILEEPAASIFKADTLNMKPSG
jgi:hypothetical protein